MRHILGLAIMAVLMPSATSAFQQPWRAQSSLSITSHRPKWPSFHFSALRNVHASTLQAKVQDDENLFLETKSLRDDINEISNPNTIPTDMMMMIMTAATAMMMMLTLSEPAMAAVTSISTTTTTSTTLVTAAASPIGSAAFAWLHFLGIMGVAGGLVTERLVIKKNMSVDEENIINGADLIYGLSALSLLITGYFRVSAYAKGWDYYKNEPIFWIKMSSVAVLGALSFFPAIVFFRRDMARKEGANLPPLSDKLVERCTTIINAELLAILTIPFMASLMARGVLYVNDLPWGVGAGLYAVSLGGAGYKYISEALTMMEEEGALVPMEDTEDAK